MKSCLNLGKIMPGRFDNHCQQVCKPDLDSKGGTFRKKNLLILNMFPPQNKTSVTVLKQNPNQDVAPNLEMVNNLLFKCYLCI